jgi:hypothetical protein
MGRWASIMAALAVGTLAAGCVLEQESPSDADEQVPDGESYGEPPHGESSQPTYISPYDWWRNRWWRRLRRDPIQWPRWPSGELCGGSVCGPGEYCCNPSCGICAPLGGACTHQVCEIPWPR